MTSQTIASQKRGSIFYRIAIVALFVLGIGVGVAAQVVRPSIVALGSTTHDFGETHSGQHLKCTLAIRNPHPYWENVYPMQHQMCGCMHVTVKPAVLAPHAEGVATLEMDPHDVEQATHASQVIPIGTERFGKESALWVTLNYFMMPPVTQKPAKSVWHGPAKATPTSHHPPSARSR